MADIKTKDVLKGSVKTIDKAAVASQRMKRAYIATKEKAEHSTHASESSTEDMLRTELSRRQIPLFTRAQIRLIRSGGGAFVKPEKIIIQQRTDLRILRISGRRNS